MRSSPATRFICTRPLHDSEGSGNGQYASPARVLACPHETCGIKAIESSPARIGIREVQGQSPQIAGGGHELSASKHLLRRDRIAGNPRIALEQTLDLVFTLLGFQRADAINQCSARLEQLD